MDKDQTKWYAKYIQRRSLGMPVSDFKPLVRLYNELFDTDIDVDDFFKASGIIHKITKIEKQLDNIYYDTTKTLQ